MTQDMHVYGIMKRATSEMNRSAHTLSILMKQLRSRQEAGKKQLRNSLEAGKRQSGARLVNEITARRQRDYGLSLTRLRLVIIMLLALMTFGATNALAQTDYSGLYYIGSVGYNANNTTTNYYLCPTEGWCYYQATDDFTSTDNGMPFLTTYQCRNGAYDASKAVWKIEKAPGSSYYYIRQYETGKYLVANGIIRTTSDGWDRMRVHLEEVADPATKGNNILFNIYTYSTYKVIQSIGINEPKDGYHDGHSNHRWLTVNNGNSNSLTGQSGKGGGPTGYTNTAGIVGIYTENDKNAPFYLEPVPVPTPTFTVKADGTVEMTSSEDGTKIYYTLDGSDPTTSSTIREYNATAIPSADVLNADSVKAIAVRTLGSQKSAVATLPVNTYHYYIVNKSGVVTIAADAKQAAGKPISYSDIPEAIRSTYIADETITFYSLGNTYNVGDTIAPSIFESTNPIKKTEDGANIYVTYNTTNLNKKFLALTNANPYNIKDNEGKCRYDESGTLNTKDAASEYESDQNYMWYFGGSDPYHVTIQNLSTKNYLHYNGSELSVEATEQTFILKNTDNHTNLTKTAYEDVTFMDADGHEFTIRVNTVVLPITFTLIDRQGKLIQEMIEYEGTFELPLSWKSPLVSSYTYFKKATITTNDNGENIYTFANEDKITRVDELNGNTVIYVTYNPDPSFSFDVSDNDTIGSQAYRLSFTDGQTFNQENGKDSIMTSSQKAVYPYSNGDASLYVYGTEQWNTQLSSGASTRTRWLWYVVSENSDPYHVKIMSHQAQASSHNYFRTFAAEYGDSKHIVTSVTTLNPAAASLPPTEYMVLTGPHGKCRLVTVNAINDGTDNERRTVTNFEQYWKNNPTVQNLLGTDKITVDESYNDDIELNAAQKGKLPKGWHTYKAFANAAPWAGWKDDNIGTGKQYLEKHHWFQTIDMGSNGEFDFVETTLEPQVILLDQHGWEIMRAPLSKPEELKKYDSPMVETYHWYPTASKQSGYHKFLVSNPKIPVYMKNASNKWVVTTDSITHDSKTLADNPYSHFVEKGFSEQDKSVKSDFYVTYDVKTEYTDKYAGAATEDATVASKFLIKQGNEYAKIDGTSLSTASTLPATIGDDLQWYLRPNFNIDAEMGYVYEGEYDEKSKEETEEEYVSEGKNGFDPYNLQIQSVQDPTRYFRTNDNEPTLVNGTWTGTSSTIRTLSLNNPAPVEAEGNDQTTLSITNATFMVVNDGNNNMVLMPRFDHAHVVNSLTGSTQFVNSGSNTQYLTVSIVPTVVKFASDIKTMGGSYILDEDFSVDESIGTADAPFAGIIDGQMRTLSSFGSPLVAYAKDAIIKNFAVKSVSISSGTDAGNVGAIVCEATGKTRIYNVGINGGSVGGSNYVGGLVGLLADSSRVINCYSYANITGGSYVGGIVGYNNYASSADNIHTMVMNCMYYGNIAGGSNKAPIYNGSIISNKFEKNITGLGNYNYFLAEQPYVQNNQIDTYNCALMAETRFLQRFEFFRLLLNSHLELAAWYATGNFSNKSEMMKWVLETADRSIGSPMPYPVLKRPGKYPSIINFDAANAPTGGERNTGKNMGTLNVRIQMGDGGKVYDAPTEAAITKSDTTLIITDKDSLRHNFNYYKVQLPYYNEVGTKNYTGNRVVTGWKITSITGGTTGSFTTGSDDATTDANGNITAAPYNFADRNCTNKDLYSVSGRVFNQGAYWDVPEGVTGITIEPYWAKAAYLADAHPDMVYNQAMNISYNVDYVGGGEIYENGKKYKIAGEDQKVYTSVGNAKNALDQNTSVYDCAIVLVGNAHNVGISSTENNRSYTIMSADFDHDNEPDYSYILRFDKRCQTHPVRVDFLNIPGLGMAQKSTGGKGSYNFGIMQPIGWFESTNTSLFRVTQFEYDRENRNAAPLILQGGVIEQWVSGQTNGVKNLTTYFHVGGNVWFKEFHRGTHQDNTYKAKHPPVSVTGGDFDEFYLTGLYKAVETYNDNAECYINGGRFGIVAGTGLEGLGDANNHTNGNIVWQIQNADINEFYGGGINAASPIQGNITTVITGGYIKQFCGGPKFGDMRNEKTVTTTANNCTFGTYFGAGYGGNSYSRQAPFNYNNVTKVDWNEWIKGNKKAENDANYNGYQQDYKNKNYNRGIFEGVSTQFSYQFLPMSDNTSNVGRLFIEYVKFSLATTRKVTSTLNNCTVTGNFYGGGSLGKVDGDVTSTLNNCTVNGNAFGAGFSASLPTVAVDSIGFRTEPKYNENAGTFSQGVKGTTTTYTWAHHDDVNSTENAIDKTNHILYTTEDLTTLGTVTGKVTLNIDGTTTVGGNVDGGNVYGGGESSDATGDVNVNILNGSMTDVYGGGKGQTTIVGGDVTVNIGAKTGTAPSFTYTGGATINGSVYGGSALGAVNTKSTKDGEGNVTDYIPNRDSTTTVNIYSGTVLGSVFGGGLGEKTDESDIAAQNFGKTIVNMEGGTVSEAVYGGANANGVLKGDAEVTIANGTVGTAPDPVTEIVDAVFGGGKGEPTLVEGHVTVNIGNKGQDIASGANIYGHVYGGSALGNTNASRPAEELVFIEGDTTAVNLYAGTIHGNVFGGGLGQKASAEPALEAIESIVGGDVTVQLNGAKLAKVFTGEGDDRMPLSGQIFGANNLNGTPKGHVKVWVKRTVNTDPAKNVKHKSETALANRNIYDVTAVYGGGNQADYRPTSALNKEGNDTTYAEVLIDGCDTTSIQYVYGGGNAAAVPATEITINGAYIIDQVFGGGNGKSTATYANPGAHVGVNDTTAYKADNTKGIYGTGIATTKLVGGQIHVVYGGSNTKGNVRGGTKLMRSESEGACALKVGEIYGAGQVAPMDGNVNIVLECMPKSFVEQVFGGAKNATVNGNVSLTVTSGKFGRVFGGNNEGGSINGSITVNVYEHGCKPLIIGELYGGGYNAPYSIFGCNSADNGNGGLTWTAKESGESNVLRDDAIQVNVYSCASIGKVFGGGFGATAKVVGNTHVWINTMKGIVDEEKQDTIGTIGQVFGGGNAAPVKGNTLIEIGTATASEDVGVKIIGGTKYLNPVVDKDTTIVAGIYGGGYSADVEGKAKLYIGTVNQNLGVNIAGNIFGGGYGASTHVTDSVIISIGAKTPGTESTPDTYTGNAVITGDVYGGSALGCVNAYDDNGTPTATTDAATMVTLHVGTVNGSIYGGGLGQRNGVNGAESDIISDVYGPVTVTMESGSANKVFGCNNLNGSPQKTVAVNIYGGTINNSVYGGGNQAAYTAPEGSKNHPTVTITNGTVKENVFGGGYGLTATVTGNPQITIGDNVEGHQVAIKKSVYGGGEQAIVDGNTNIVMNSGTIGTVGQGGAEYGNIYGGGWGSIDNTLAGLVKGNTNIVVHGDSVLHNIYGGGAYASVGNYTYNNDTKVTTCAEGTGTANITILSGIIGTDGHDNGMVFGASRGDVSAPNGVHDSLAWVNNTVVVIGTKGEGTAAPQPQVKGSVYGSGENGHTYHNASVTIHSGMVGITEAMPSDPEGQKGANYPNRGNVYGGGCGTDKYVDTSDDNKKKYNPLSGIVNDTTKVLIDGGHVVRNVYGAGAMGSAVGGTSVTINGGTVGVNGSNGGNVYAAARGDDELADANQAYVGSTELNVKNGTIWGSAFGGGQAGIVKGSVNVKVTGGTIKNDVYGGGALANTNTNNWDASNVTATYEKVADSLTAGSCSVTGLYKKDGNNYIFMDRSDAKAEEGAKYYRIFETGWAEGKTSASDTTKIILTGGTIGNVYGGGLGNDATPVFVYGNVIVNVNKPSDIAAYGGTGATFTRELAQNVTVGGKNYASIPVTGSIFGANNFNGSPKGDVTVEIWATKRMDGKAHVIGDYEVQAVYGGGNMANYLPAAGRGTKVIIHGCDDTSIEKVYGGGNSASVPSTNVTILGAFDIGYAFGGGNGSRPVKNASGTWMSNAGAMVTGNAEIYAKGGRIGQVFGGSDAKGDILGSPKIDTNSGGGECELSLTRIFGAGNEADVAGDVNIILSGCSTSDAVQFVHGGSYNAHISGNVTLTITSGVYTNVFGGNDARGSIGGHITVNIEETDDCKPIIIHNLMGGGNEAPYPGTKKDSTEYEDSEDRYIEVNVKSATRIDNIYGGGLKADVKGNTTVNINMMKGSQVNKDYTIPPSYTGDPIPNIVNNKIKDSIGTIGSVFGGGNEGNVIGNTTVNIGTLDSIYILKRDRPYGAFINENRDSVYNYKGELQYDMVDGNKVARTIPYEKKAALGAHITGNVFGGGNAAYVTGNSAVNICTADYSALGTDFEDISIAKSVYGGGNAGDVQGNTNVTMAGGYVYDGVYGGGLMGSVGTAAVDGDGHVLAGAIAYHTGDAAHAGCIGKIVNYKENTGKTTVVISDGQVGPVEVATEGMKKIGGPVDVGFVFGAGRGEVEDPATDADADFRTYVKETDVTISGGIVMASVYGGGENGRVAANTLVKIEGGQIGCGAGKTQTVNGVLKPLAYTVRAIRPLWRYRCQHGGFRWSHLLWLCVRRWFRLLSLCD